MVRCEETENVRIAGERGSGSSSLRDNRVARPVLVRVSSSCPARQTVVQRARELAALSCAVILGFNCGGGGNMRDLLQGGCRVVPSSLYCRCRSAVMLFLSSFSCLRCFTKRRSSIKSQQQLAHYDCISINPKFLGGKIKK